MNNDQELEELLSKPPVEIAIEGFRQEASLIAAAEDKLIATAKKAAKSGSLNDLKEYLRIRQETIEIVRIKK